MTDTSAHLRVGACGAVAGAINAWLCYARVPAAVGENPDFAWHLIPAGAVHGAVLAVCAFGLAARLSKRSLGVRLAAALPLAWIAGFASWIPLNRSAFDQPWLRSLTWPFHSAWNDTLVAPLTSFGLVALVYYLALVLLRGKPRSLATHMLCASAAGALGSLWWWILFEPWYFSLLHGAIWGACVGAGVWGVSRRGRTGMQTGAA
jgi:hypothetical protein